MIVTSGAAPADTFESSFMQRQGLLLGGAFSPHFLRDSTAMWWDIPWAVRLRHCRVLVCAQAAQEPLASWLPLIEKVAGAGESLLVVTATIGSELLSTFVVNAFKGTLPVCVVHPAGDRSGNLYVADATNNIIEKIASNGTQSTFAMTGDPSAPHFLALLRLR